MITGQRPAIWRSMAATASLLKYMVTPVHVATAGWSLSKPFDNHRWRRPFVECRSLVIRSQHVAHEPTLPFQAWTPRFDRPRLDGGDVSDVQNS